MSKPTEIVDWAEGAGAQTSEPVNERAGGFPFRYVLPAEQINWMWRTTGRWINWLQNKVDNHVHDGGAADDSVAKIDLKNHIEYGAQGYFEVTEDTLNRHTITHKQRGTSVAVLESQRLKSSALFLLGNAVVFAYSDEPRIGFQVRDIDNEFVAAADVEVMGDLYAGTIRGSELVVLEAAGTNHGVVTANNTIKAWGMVNASTATTGALITGEGIEYIDRNIDGSGPWVGTWDITLSSAVPDTSKVAVFVSGQNIYSRITWTSTTQLTVEILEIGGGLSNTNFSIQLLYVGA